VVEKWNNKLVRVVIYWLRTIMEKNKFLLVISPTKWWVIGLKTKTTWDS